MSRSAIAGLVLLSLAWAAVPAAAQKKHYAPVRPNDEEAVSIEPAPTATNVVIAGNGIDYHGGPVMTPTTGDGIVNLYFIWYGNWTNGPRASDSQNTRDLLSALFSSTGP